ncbi:hypothetical protein [Undibacterium sp. TJN19]|uniref:hypothetical protein n=1 Tax=Undibacterium sp. TJN19 TaxID=3413055 RepID=UPI003BF163FE
MAIYKEFYGSDGVPYAVMLPDDDVDEQLEALASRNSLPPTWQAGLSSLFQPDNSRYQDESDIAADLSDMPSDSHGGVSINRSPAYANLRIPEEMYLPSVSGRFDMYGDDDTGLGTWGHIPASRDMTGSFALPGMDGLVGHDSLFSSDMTRQCVREQMANEADRYANQSEEPTDAQDFSAQNRNLLNAANRLADADYYTDKNLDQASTAFSNTPWLDGGRSFNDPALPSDIKMRSNSFDTGTFGYSSPQRNLYPADRPTNDGSTELTPAATMSGFGQLIRPRLSESSGQLLPDDMRTNLIGSIGRTIPLIDATDGRASTTSGEALTAMFKKNFGYTPAAGELGQFAAMTGLGNRYADDALNGQSRDLSALFPSMSRYDDAIRLDGSSPALSRPFRINDLFGNLSDAALDSGTARAKNSPLSTLASNSLWNGVLNDGYPATNIDEQKAESGADRQANVNEPAGDGLLNRTHTPAPQTMLGSTRLIEQTKDYVSASELHKYWGGKKDIKSTTDLKNDMMDWQAKIDPDFTNEISRKMGLFAKITAAISLTDRPEEVVRMYAVPDSSKYDELRAMLDPDTHNLAAGVTKQDFYQKARDLGLRMTVQESGITNSVLQSYSNSRSLIEEMDKKGTPTIVLNTYNATHGVLPDGIESMLTKFGLDSAPVIGTRIAIQEAKNYNKILSAESKENIYTQVWGHSEGTLIANQAIEGIDKNDRSDIDLHNFGVATGDVPSGLHAYKGVGNINDSVYTKFGKSFTATGGVPQSRNFIEANNRNPDSYQFKETDFKVAANGKPVEGEKNHSWQYYMSDPVAREALGLAPLDQRLQDFYNHSYWIHNE